MTSLRRLLFALLVGAQRVVKFRDSLLKLVHHQRPVLVKERRHRLSELGLPADPGLSVSEGDSERVLVIEPGTDPDVSERAP